VCCCISRGNGLSMILVVVDIALIKCGKLPFVALAMITHFRP
jgi:hypothetical protein